MKPFRRDAIMEQVLRMRDEQPSEFKHLSDKLRAARQFGLTPHTNIR
jgi:hypothetical protein